LISVWISFHVRGWLVISAYDYERKESSQLCREKHLRLRETFSVFHYDAQRPGICPSLRVISARQSLFAEKWQPGGQRGARAGLLPACRVLRRSSRSRMCLETKCAQYGRNLHLRVLGNALFSKCPLQQPLYFWLQNSGKFFYFDMLAWIFLQLAVTTGGLRTFSPVRDFGLTRGLSWPGPRAPPAGGCQHDLYLEQILVIRRIFKNEHSKSTLVNRASATRKKVYSKRIRVIGTQRQKRAFEKHSRISCRWLAKSVFKTYSRNRRGTSENRRSKNPCGIRAVMRGRGCALRLHDYLIRVRGVLHTAWSVAAAAALRYATPEGGDRPGRARRR